MNSIVGTLLLLAIVVASSTLLYNVTMSSMESTSADLERTTIKPIIVYQSGFIPPNWILLRTNQLSNPHFFINNKEPLNVYSECDGERCTYYLLSPLFCEQIDSVKVVSSGGTAVVKPTCPTPIIRETLDRNNGWDTPAAGYTFYLCEGVEGNAFCIETNKTTVGWSWICKVFHLPEGNYIMAAYIKKENMIETHIPINPVGSKQISQIRDKYSVAPPAAHGWLLEASSFQLPSASDVQICLNAGWSTDGNTAYAAFDEFRIYPMFFWKIKRLIIDFDSNSSYFTPYDANLYESNGWIVAELNTNGYLNSIPVEDPNIANPMYLLYLLEFNGDSYPSTGITYYSGAVISGLIGNCGPLTNSGTLFCASLARPDILDADINFKLGITTFPRPATIRVRNIKVYEVIPVWRS